MPNGTTIEDASSCSITDHIMSGIQSYSNQLSQSVYVAADASGLLWKAAFSTSVDYTTIAKQTMNESTIVVSSYLKCGYYTLGLDTPFNGPKIDTNFYDYIVNMPLNYSDDPDYFFKFIDQDYGTHFISDITFGGRFGQNAQFSYYSYSSFTSSNLDIDVAANFSTMDAGGATESLTAKQKNESDAYNSATRNRDYYYVGGKLPANGSAVAWQTSLGESPIIILNYNRTYLLTTDVFPDINPNDLKKKQDALYEALSIYCQQIASNYSFVYCAGLPPDLPLPDGSIFGGIYDYSSDNNYIINNIYTEQGSCKTPVSQNKPYVIAEYAMCDSNGSLILDDQVRSLCLNTSYINDTNKEFYDPMNYFGGIYTTSCMIGHNIQIIYTKYNMSKRI